MELSTAALSPEHGPSAATLWVSENRIASVIVNTKDE